MFVARGGKRCPWHYGKALGSGHSGVMEDVLKIHDLSSRTSRSLHKGIVILGVRGWLVNNSLFHR